MPQAVTVYRWDDAGAPQIGSGDLWPGILNILKKCLVEGYGTKTAAGWTVEYEDVAGAKCVFRNDPVEGSGGYVQFQKQNNYNVWFKSATFMLGVDEYTNPGYMSALVLGANFNNCRWILMASKTAFYFTFFWTTSNILDNGVNSNTIFCGDFISFIKNDPGTFISVGAQFSSFNSANTESGLSSNNIAALSRYFMQSSLSNSANSNLQIMIPLLGDGSLINTPHIFMLGVTNSSTRNQATPQGPQLAAKLFLARIGLTPSTDPNHPNFRGFLPGFVCLPFSYWYLSPWPVISEGYYLISENRENFNTQGGGSRLINMIEWESPNRD